MTSFHMPGREPSLASQLDLELWYQHMKLCFPLFSDNIIESNQKVGTLKSMQVMTVALSLFTPCLRHCMFCSIFTLLGVLQVPISFCTKQRQGI